MTDDFGPPLSFVGYENGPAQDWRDLSLEHSVSVHDVSQEFTWQTFYDLPFGKGRWADLHGWGERTVRWLDDQHSRLSQQRRMSAMFEPMERTIWTLRCSITLPWVENGFFD